MLAPRADQRIPQAPERGPPFLSLAKHPDVHHQVLERPTLVEVAQDQVELSHDELEHVDLAVEELQQVRLHGILGPHVHDVDLAVLTESMHPPDPLLDPERVPRKIVVYDGPSELEVPALAPRLRAQKDLAVLAERPHRRVLRREGETAVV